MSSLVAGVHSSGSSVRLQALLKALQVQLTSQAPKLPPYVHVVSDTVPAILDVLDLWMNSSKSTHKMLESYRNMGALPGVSFALQRSMAEQGAQRRDAIKQYLLNMPHSELAQLPIVAPGEPLSVARSKIRANLDSLAAVFEAMMGSNVYTREVEWYNDMKVFLPPEELRKRHGRFGAAWRQISQVGEMERNARRKASLHLGSR